MRTCRQCEVEKPETSFDSVAPGRRRGTCRQCRNANRASNLPPASDSASDIAAEYRRRTTESDLRQKVDLLVQENERVMKLIAAMRPIKPAKPVVFAVGKPVKHEAVPLWVASDWHVEERVDGNKIQGLNDYTLSEAEARAKRFFQNGLRLNAMAARDSVVKKMVLVLGGDLFSNSIHEELLESNQLGPTQAVQFVVDLIVAGIQTILSQSDVSIEIPCVVGNHGRITKKIRFATAVENNLEYLAYQWIASQFKDEPRVKFHICPGTMQYLDLFDGYLIRIVHGYEIKSGGGIGGVTIPIRKKLAAWDSARQASLTLIMHFHQRIDGGNFMVNGSLIGFNEYAQANGFSPEPPQQTWALIHSRNGGEKTVVAPIWVTEDESK